MKNKHKNLEDLDFLTELTISEQEGISGGFGELRDEQSKDPQGRPTPSTATGTRQPQEEGSIIIEYKYPTITI